MFLLEKRVCFNNALVTRDLPGSDNSLQKGSGFSSCPKCVSPLLPTPSPLLPAETLQGKIASSSPTSEVQAWTPWCMASSSVDLDT